MSGKQDSTVSRKRQKVIEYLVLIQISESTQVIHASILLDISSRGLQGFHLPLKLGGDIHLKKLYIIKLTTIYYLHFKFSWQ